MRIRWKKNGKRRQFFTRDDRVELQKQKPRAPRYRRTRIRIGDRRVRSDFEISERGFSVFSSRFFFFLFPTFYYNINTQERVNTPRESNTRIRVIRVLNTSFVRLWGHIRNPDTTRPRVISFSCTHKYVVIRTVATNGRSVFFVFFGPKY